MAVATPVMRTYQCVAILRDGRPCGKVFDDDTGAAPCPMCGNADDTLINEAEEEEAQEEAPAPARRPQTQAAHPVRSAPLANGKAAKGKAKAGGGKPSAIVRRETLTRSRGPIERVSAWVVLLVSYIGTVVALHGGWEPIIAQQFSAAAIVGGVLLQTLLTYIQWAYYHRRLMSYCSRALDTVLTAMGYGPLFVVALTAFWAARGVDTTIGPWPGAMVAAWVTIGLVSFGLAWYPESRLVD